MKTIRPFLRSFGGKYYITKWLLSLLPSNYVSYDYIETHFGGGSLFWNMLPTVSSLINDIDPTIISVYCVIRDNFGSLDSTLSSIEYLEQTFNYWLNLIPLNSYEKAIKEIILRRMSRGSMKKTFSTSSRLRGGQNECKNSWETSLKNLKFYHDRLQGVDISCVDASNIIRQRIDSTTTLFYIDPPYLPQTRKAKKVYDYEMTQEQHIELLELCNMSKSKILISGYESILYNDKLKNWNIYKKIVSNSSGQNKVKNKREELVWKNF